MEQTAPDKNFNTISPSAKWILLMKGYTNIPFARRAAELIQYPEKFVPDYEKTDRGFWGRTLHFESRYWSIDQLLAELPVKNILELSAGFSFRGLDMVQQEDVYYIDTDLPDMIEKKKELIKALCPERSDRKGKLELLALNVLDDQQFRDTVSRFPQGELAIVNEGLLIYLDQKEKEKLCGIIHRELKERGGYWITADIYLKVASRNIDLSLDEQTKKFFEDHNVENNRFESFEAAADLFTRMGFVIEKEADIDYTALSAFPYFKKQLTKEIMERMSGMEKIHATWRLRPA